ncbi:MAG: helix-turn-helix domain-containing protein [Sulfuricella sp.]|nr:helix-turn-helix domain-containing protein [Sulfuricella sp.]
MINAKQVFDDFVKLDINERTRFFSLLSNTIEPDHMTHDELFGDLKDAEFTAQESAKYLEISMATFRRHLKNKKIRACSTVGNVHLFSIDDLRAFKNAMNLLQ